MPQRQKSKSCPYHPKCPGCPLLDIPYKEQLKAKHEHLLRYLKDYSHLLRSITPAPKPFQYRNRAKLALGSRGRFGLYQQGTHHLVHIPECPIHMSRINHLAQAVMKQVQKRKIPLYQEETHQGFLRYLIIRQAQKGNALHLTLVTRNQAFPEGVTLARALRRNTPHLVGVVQNVNSQRTNVIEGSQYLLLAGKDLLKDRINQFRILISSGTFLQGNHKTAEKLYQTLTHQGVWHRDDQIYDLYAGLGIAGLHLASKTNRIVGVENKETAIQNARLTAKVNKKENMAFWHGEVEKLLPKIQKRMGPPNAIILNPPRRGCPKEVLDWINKSKADRIAYISCSPRTLARDIQVLQKGHFAVRKIQGFDMYPQTEQIECLAFLERG